MQYFGSNIVEGVAESWVEAEMSWVEVEMSWVELGARFSNTHNFTYGSILLNFSYTKLCFILCLFFLYFTGKKIEVFISLLNNSLV